MSLGSWLKVVGGIAAIVLSGGTLGVVAGAMMLASAAADFGIIGGSLGKFLKSSTFQYMTMAVGLGSAATSMFGSSTGAVGAQEMASTSADLHATVGATMATDATNIANDAAATNASFLQSAGVGADVAHMAAAANVSESTSGLTASAVNAANGDISSQFGAGAAQASESQNAATGAAGQTLQQGGSPAGPGMKAMAPQGAGEGGASAGTPGTLPSGVEPVDAAGNLQASTGAGPPDLPAGGAPATGESGGFLNKAMGLVDKHPGLVQGAGSMISGIGQGIGQKQAMEDMIKAQQWGNMQWQNQGQVDKMQAAAAKPITVPQGYLQRAQQTRSLMQGNQGMAPLPAATPGAPLAPSPVHV